VNVLGLKDEPRAWTRPELVTSVHPDDRQKFAASVDRLTPDNPATQVSYRVVRPDGSLVWLEKNARAFFDEQGKKIRMIGMVADITERKQAEEALRDSEEQYRRVVDHLHDALIIDDADGHVIFANDRFLQMFGIDREELSTIRLEDHVAPEWHSRVRQGHDRRVGGEDVPAHFEYEGIRRDGQRIWLEANVVPIHDVTGRVTHTQSVIRDITQRKLADDAIASVSRRLIEAQEQERTRIARELHDDVNQRIALLAIELDQLKQYLHDSALIHRFQGICEQLFVLGKDVQGLSHRLHSSKLEYLGLAAAARSFCQELSEQQNVEIEFEHADVPPNLSEEASLCLFRILQEALHNAVKHSGVAYFKVDLRQTGDTIQLSVSDTGMGFDPEVAMTQHGLGLVSMRERVSLVGGTIAIKSAPNHGVVIQVQIPTAKMPAPVTTRQFA
jgi:PAS domain S-box-containing protein